MTNHPLCAVDRRPVHDAGNLCAACWADLEHDLAEVFASLADDLDITLAGLGRSGGSPIGIVVRSASRGVGFDERAGDLARQLHNCLGGWVRVVYEDEVRPRYICSLCRVDRTKHAHGPMPWRTRHPHGFMHQPQDWLPVKPPLTVADRTNCLAGWLGTHEREVRRHEAVGELWQEIHGLVEQVRRVTRPASEPKVYLGVCSAHIDEVDGERIYCDADLYAPPGWQGIRCPSCGTMHAISQRREVMLAAVAGQLLSAVEMSRAMTAMTDREISVNTIRSWAHRGKLQQHDPREGETSPRYRVGDVEKLVVQSIVQKAG